jgi:hypothetical protein
MMLTQWMPFAAAVIVLVTTMLMGVVPRPAISVDGRQRHQGSTADLIVPRRMV